MTALAKRSRGHDHSKKIKMSAGWARYCEARGAPKPQLISHYLLNPQVRKAIHRGGRKLIPDPKSYVNAINFELILEQLKAAFKSGYIQALKDVDKERKRQELASYEEVMKSKVISKQELATINHAYDRPRR